LWSPMEDVKRHRWLRQMYEVPVYPSVDLSAKVKAAFWNGNEQILSVELTNKRTDRPTDLFVTLDKLSVASRHYKLEALPGQFITSEENGNVLQIGWQERVTIHYKVIPLEKESKVCLLSECSFTEMAKSTTIECIYSKATDYLCLERARESFEVAWRAHQVEIAKGEDDGEQQHPRSIASIRRANIVSDHDGAGDSLQIEAHPTSIGQLCSHDNSLSKIHLICSWRAILGQEVIRGEHHLRGIPVRPISFFNGCPIVATASHAPSIAHDFTKGPAGLPIKLTLRNLLLESPVNLILSVKDSTTFEMIGFNVMRLSFEPQEEKTIPLEALIPWPGVHNLQAFDLTVKRDEEEFLYPLKQQWIITVSDTI